MVGVVGRKNIEAWHKYNHKKKGRQWHLRSNKGRFGTPKHQNVWLGGGIFDIETNRRLPELGSDDCE